MRRHRAVQDADVHTVPRMLATRRRADGGGPQTRSTTERDLPAADDLSDEPVLSERWGPARVATGEQAAERSQDAVYVRGCSPVLRWPPPNLLFVPRGVAECRRCGPIVGEADSGQAEHFVAVDRSKRNPVVIQGTEDFIDVVQRNDQICGVKGVLGAVLIRLQCGPLG